MKRVLIVDDSQLSRNYHSYVMRDAGFEVETADGGAAALEKLMLERFDLVLTDINMRGMDGYDLIRRMRGSEQLTQVPIVIISTEKGDADRRMGFEAGANFCLAKPATPQQIVETVRMMTEDV
jgi:two-component system, chemotaxis family, chemotaxis protein CheY